MGSNESITHKLMALIAGVVHRTRPVKVEPRGRWRVSGPVETPSDWWDRPLDVQPQCNLCHERPLRGSPPLVRGLCGVCRQRLDDETPTAA